MFHIINQNAIEEGKLDQRNYFQSLFSEACDKHVLEDAQIERIQIELMELMAKQVERYTNDESSSIRIETAQQLLQSVCYILGVYLKSTSDMNRKIELIKNEKISKLFYLGMEEIESYIRKSKEMLEKLQAEQLKVDNYAYQDTLSTGIPEFFHDYVIEFGAQDDPGSIDYPLCNTIVNLSGIEYIHEYLRRLTQENQFCRKLSDTNIEMLLRGLSKDYMHILVNIYELVLTNALGCELLGQSVIELNITFNDRIWLQKTLANLNVKELQKKLEDAYGKICIELCMEEDRTDYTREAIQQIAVRLQHNLQMDTLEKLFISFVLEEEPEELIYEDGKQMEDDKLRKFIEEMKECRFTEDKIAMLRTEIHSLNDLTELLEECFNEEEYEEVFRLLSDTELTLLKRSIGDEQELENRSEFNPLKEWQEKLLGYMD